MFTTLLR